MEIVALVFFLVGFVIALIYGIKLLILAFQTSLLWGLGYIFIPFVALIFVIVHWEDAKSPFLRGLLAIPFYIIGAVLMPQSSGMYAS
ncbi:hypothetical protein [Cerasicoccus arenae]|uniref:Uncharacterized protein n=1 Tax=Cerasicoccus arenae TaxID=424488 RepID=A0A8J3GD18_9BACT|nr:hypothetical protein [Cerasicoccus arenae]MBK1859742.1 hypothetical protein [Cerasicoccus arenae]GHB93543.1 hypothetical protein GCM10007047_06280 [Cerasicoccus arenae]